MNLKEKLQELKSKILDSTVYNRDYEFETELENHPLGSQNIYRLHYLDYHRIGESFSHGSNNVGVIDIYFKPFMLPSQMSREEAFKVLSYLTDYLEKNLKLEEEYLESVRCLDTLLDFASLGFRRVNLSLSSKSDEVIDLFTISGRLLLFKNSNLYPKYFEWYTSGVTFAEVKSIYAKCGLEFSNLDLSAYDPTSKLIRKK